MNDLEKLVDVKALVNDPGKNNKAYDDEKRKRKNTLNISRR